ncbi:MAG: NUDIX hydrolase [Propionibacteriaceae bacterium]|nr:NUDIX hydrolase [Propionibacteriaceae bacterium]
MNDLPDSAARLPVAVDIVALTIRSRELMVLLTTRLLDPFAGCFALPGGFVLAGESLSQAAVRELKEETSVSPQGHLEQLGSYGPLERDPRGPVLSVAYMSLSNRFEAPNPGGDATSADWYPIRDVPPLAFDHHTILTDGINRAQAKLEYTGLASAFCTPEFTISELRAVYEAVWGVRLDPRNFHRKILGTTDFLEPVGTRQGIPGPSATTYRVRPGLDPASTILNPPVLRPG